MGPLASLSELASHVDALAELATVDRNHQDAPRSALDDQRLAMVRLGIAGSLFTALRCRHPHTAQHSLRVALRVSAWCAARGASVADCDALEVAALLHDVGKIGVPDDVLLKPGPLSRDEAALMEHRRRMSLEILCTSCAVPAVLDIVRHAGAWYDGTHGSQGLVGDALPLAARMLAIVDAFDAMTVEQIYRPAQSHEWAVAELYRNACTQFDPSLVAEFCKLDAARPIELECRAASRWLKELAERRADDHWRLSATDATSGSATPIAFFQQRLLDDLRDGVVFVDNSFRILYWNLGVERLTGMGRSGVDRSRWSPNLLGMCDEQQQVITEASCPVIDALRNGVQSIRRMTVRGRSGRRVSVEARTTPVIADDGTHHGAALLLHDVSPQMSLEARCQSLYELATKDPLTQVANRAEFDRVFDRFVVAHLEHSRPCSLIICDIDRFKQVNDIYGHQAGDVVIRCLANLLKCACHSGDLVARYGGEEFVLLCADCDNAAAARRAAELRRALEQIPHRELGGRSVTASFGVTEIQLGDTAATMLRRADRALFCAKNQGRNAVVQLGTGFGGDEERPVATSFESTSARHKLVAEAELVASVPRSVCIEKLRGFIADHEASAASHHENHMRLTVGPHHAWLLRRRADRQISFVVDLTLDEEHVELDRRSMLPIHALLRTRVRVAIRARDRRNRRRADAADLARQLLASLRAYLMATPAVSPESTGPISMAETR